MTLKTRPFLTHQDTRTIAAACAAEAAANGWNVGFAIVDDGGHLLWFERLDGAAPSTAELAPAKARLAALGRRETRTYEEMINGGRVSFLSGLAQAGLRGAGLEGGVPIVVDGHCVGAVGVSGVKSADDARIAQAGIRALLG